VQDALHVSGHKNSVVEPVFNVGKNPLAHTVHIVVDVQNEQPAGHAVHRVADATKKPVVQPEQVSAAPWHSLQFDAVHGAAQASASKKNPLRQVMQVSGVPAVHVAQFGPQAVHATPGESYTNPGRHTVHKSTVLPVQVAQFAAQATQAWSKMKKPLIQVVQTVIDVHSRHYSEHSAAQMPVVGFNSTLGAHYSHLVYVLDRQPEHATRATGH